MKRPEQKPMETSIGHSNLAPSKIDRTPTLTGMSRQCFRTPDGKTAKLHILRRDLDIRQTQ